MRSLRQAAIDRLRAWSLRRHGADALPALIDRRRIYILPTRFGLVLASLLIVMVVAALNYNSNLGLAYAFLMAGLALVAMHHCHRNLLGLGVDANLETDAFAGGRAAFGFMLRNSSAIERRDIEVACFTGAGAAASVAANGALQIQVEVPVAGRGVNRTSRFELRTSYPFGWFRAWTYVHVPLTAFVAPHPSGERPLPASGAAAGQSAPSESRGDEDFAGLRSYAPGVALKHMAWKVLARGQEAAVRSYTDLAAQPLWLEWSALEGLEVEARLSQLCRWVLRSESGGHPYGLRIPGTDIAPGHGALHRGRCLRALAAYAWERPT